ncbi:MAG: calcium-binding protein [Sporolactobacillus sp.]
MVEACEKRLIKILGASHVEGEEDELPMVSEETLELYFNYLKEHLVFSFPAIYDHDTDFLSGEKYSIEVLGIAEPIDNFCGLICSVRMDRKKRYVPMGDIEVGSNNQNYQLIEDYNEWFWNYR